jgi:hypothetical protein
MRASAVRWVCPALFALSFLFATERSQGQEIWSEFTGKLAVEGRWFPETPLFDGQREAVISFVAEPEAYLELENGYSLTVTPFYRYDSADPRRTHFDVREFVGLFFGELGGTEWELRLGADKVFWGVTESRHLVDIVNQTDLVENPDQEDKLGQPMVHLTWLTDYGALEFFSLPYFRERTFPGRSGRLRTALIADTENPVFESDAEEWHHDVALRFSHSIDVVDFGISVFDGTNREPALQLGFDDQGSLVLIPRYEQIRQYSLDAQVTTGPWLLKLESYWRDGDLDRFGQEDDFGALVGGFEYTFFGAFDSDWDVGLLGEWLFDGRGDRATNPFENDLFAGARLAANDEASTDLLFGVIQDLEERSRSLFVESSRRLNDSWSLGVEGIVFIDIDPEDVQTDTRRDSFLQVEVSYNF